MPAKIESDSEYDALHARFGKLLRQARRTKAEERLMDLLGLLTEATTAAMGLRPIAARLQTV